MKQILNTMFSAIGFALGVIIVVSGVALAAVVIAYAIAVVQHV